MKSLNVAKAYLNKGWQPVRIPPRSKNPGFKGWEKFACTVDDAAEYFTEDCNIGALLGKPSHGLTDIDLDCATAITVAPYLLPDTATFGRPSKQRSHFVYYCDGVSTKKFKDPVKVDNKNEMIVELRSTGCQTVFPGSVHPSGETIAWVGEYREPTKLDPAELSRFVARVASAALLSKHWPGIGSRHDSALALGGALLHSGWSIEETEQFVFAVCMAAGCSDTQTHVATVRDSARKREAGKNVSGWPSLTTCIGEHGNAVTTTVREWLGITSLQTAELYAAAVASTIGKTPSDFPEDDPNGPDGVAYKPKIVIGVDIEKMVDVCVPVLAGLDIYQADNRLVRLMNVSKQEAERRRVNNYAGSPVMRPAEPAHVKAVLSSNIEWVKKRTDRKGKEIEVSSKPDSDAVAALLERGSYSSINYLISLKNAPFFRPDGSLCTRAGYDSSTAIYLSLPEKFPCIPNKPTLQDAKAAIQDLLEVFRDFPHASAADKLVPVAAILTILARPAIEGPVPGFAFEANRPRTGKGLQSNAVSIIATGRDWSSASWTSDDVEIRKILDGWALDGAELVGFDDVNPSDDFNCAALRSYLTQTSIDVRRLGYSGNVKCNWRGTILATGNSMRIRRDMRGRLLRSRIESQEPHPEQRRDFAHSPLIPWVRANQPRLLRSALVVLRAWFANGRPQVIDETLGSFESWAQIVVQAIAWTTGSNVLRCVPSIGEESEEDNYLARLLEELRSRGERTAASLFEDPGFCELIREVRHGKTFTSSDIGYVLRGYKHQAVDLEDGRFWIDASPPSKTGGVKWKAVKLADPKKSDYSAEGDDGGCHPLRAKKQHGDDLPGNGINHPPSSPTFTPGDETGALSNEGGLL